MATAMSVTGKEEGEGSKGISMVTRVVGKRMATATKRAMATKTRETGKEEGTDKGSKSNGNGKEDDGYGKQGQQQ
jgi:hypothetical protein